MNDQFHQIHSTENTSFESFTGIIPFESSIRKPCGSLVLIVWRANNALSKFCGVQEGLFVVCNCFRFDFQSFVSLLTVLDRSAKHCAKIFFVDLLPLHWRVVLRCVRLKKQRATVHARVHMCTGGAGCVKHKSGRWRAGP